MSITLLGSFRWFLVLVLAGVTSPSIAQTVVGVTATEIKIGNTMPYSGLASAYAALPVNDGVPPNDQAEGRVYAGYALKNVPDAKIGILYENR